jgi:hypothetical protein
MRRLAAIMVAILLVLSAAAARAYLTPGSLMTGAAGGVNLGSYSGAVGITGNQTNGADQISHVSVNGELNAQTYGTKGDAIYSGDGGHGWDGTTNGTTTFTSPSGAFTSALVGDSVFIYNAGTSNSLYVGTVAAFVNSTTLTLSSIPPISIAGTALYVIGYDNTTSLQNWLNAIRGRGTTVGGAQYPPTISGYLPAGVYLHRGLNFGGATGIKLTGAGQSDQSGNNIMGGSVFLCIDPTTNPNGCHDFTGAGDYTVRDLAFHNGVNQDNVNHDQGAGIWNVLLARHPTAGFSISSTFQNVAFHSQGTYNVIIDNSEQNSWINDTFNANLDIATALYLTTSTSTFSSPFYGSLSTAGVSCTLNRIAGGNTQISANGRPAVVIDGTGPGDFTIEGAYIRLNQPADDFITDTANSVIFSMNLSDLRIEPNTCLLSGTSTPCSTTPTNHLINFTGSGGWNGGELHNVSWGTIGTQSGPLIAVAGAISAVHISNLESNSETNPVVAMGSGSDNQFDNINANLIKFNGATLTSLNSTHNTIGGTVNSFGTGIDPPLYMLTNGTAGAQNWTQISSAAGSGAPWGAGGMGWNNATTSVGGFSATGGLVLNSTLSAPTGAANTTPTATFADGTHCGVGGSIAGTTLAFNVAMGTTAPTTECQITLGTAPQASCLPGTFPRCVVTPMSTAGTPYQAIIASAVDGSHLNLFAQTDMHSNIEHVVCVCGA